MSSSSKTPLRKPSSAANKIARVDAEIKVPVKIVTNTAVFLGRSLNSESRALPTLVPMRSPTVAITPPTIKIAKIRMYPVVIFSYRRNPSRYSLLLPVIICGELGKWQALRSLNFHLSLFQSKKALSLEP